MINRDNRTFICSVVYYDIADYSTKSVDVQIRLKEQLNRFTNEAIKNVAVNDRILLDTGDGTAICFLGDPEDALFVAMNLRDAALSATDQFTDEPLLVRFGINLGPVKLVNDINNQKNIIGDGINVGQRVMSFAEPGQILVSRSYFEVVSCLTQEYAKLFHYLGMRADKHIRKHEIYSILRTSDQEMIAAPDEPPAQGQAPIQTRDAIAIVESRTPPPGPASAPERDDKKDIRRNSSVSIRHPHWWQTRSVVFGGVTAGVFLAVILTFFIQWNSGVKEIQPDIQSDKTALPSEMQLKIPEEAPPENTQPAEIVRPEPAESAQPAPLDANAIVQREIPEASAPDSAQSTEAADPDQTLPPIPAPLAPNATLQFAISPWGDVYVDGKRKGASPPLTNVSVSPGKHRIEIRNTTFPPYSQTCDINPNEKLKISHKF